MTSFRSQDGEERAASYSGILKKVELIPQILILPSILVFFLKNFDDHTPTLEASALWNNTKPEWPKDADARVPHELGQKRVFMLASVLELMQQDSELLQSNAEVQQVFPPNVEQQTVYTIVGISKIGGPRSSIRWIIPCGLPTQFWWRLIRSAHRKSVTLVSCVFGACTGGANSGVRLVCMGHARVTHATQTRCFARDSAGKWGGDPSICSKHFPCMMLAR